ncbi:putative mitochondrial hypothetical protein [Leptomonas pyrrhocoris]|uniref:Uncharacterized protein n=1 Tax=Leptomonas pyrrhocoris TaxID=157538 RepID=A0A0M9GAJ8_LEPPY|nr:putative mitochondrial hypothetical protein [Leptomonas pyrrhocoris]KPA86257.1 putative mitochondrial hypothetical protein [Leptomonas pyrrhocoris]|eukprot:XP_015664696.1 putative mitochondrial hypothetical protein [Leptomonas pyrrhocoris]
MNVAPLYREVLKSLSRACKTRPHFVQDARFLLSLPLLSHNNKDGGGDTVGTTASLTAASCALASQAPVNLAAPSEEPEGALTFHHTTLENYLRRPASMCYPIDTQTLFALCYADLHSAVFQPPQADGSVNPVAQQILRYRNLLWLRDRLARVLSDKTTTQLATSLSIADGPDTDDFIPDEAFDGHSRDLTGSASVTTAPHDRPVAVASGAVSDEAHTDGHVKPEKGAFSASPPPSASSRTGAAQPATVAPATITENDPDVVYSAGSIGLQGEMFVLRHREAFPMAAHFLSGFPTVPAAELAGCAHQQAALVRLVRDKYPTTVTCEDGQVSLSVAVEPFDPQYRTREHAGMGYFATAHRQFRVRFHLQPLVRDNAGAAEKTEVLVVNSYFVRLDMEVMQVVEEVGYLHSRDVLRMLRERDYGDHFSDNIGTAVADALGEGGEKDTSKGSRGAAGKTKHSKRISEDTSASTASSPDNARVFSLYFVNRTDAPMVLKGILYYKIGKRNKLATAPIRCIPFGFVLLEA